MLSSLTQHYTVEEKIGEGSFSEVFKVKKKSTGQYFAAKRLLRPFANIEEVNQYSELSTMNKLQYHPNITYLIDYVYEKDCSTLTLIVNLMDMSLYDYIKDRKKKLSESRCKNYLFQLVHGLFYLHLNGIFHRDIKPENCLLKIDPILAKTNPLRAEVIQIGDLGSVSKISRPGPRSEYVSTRWYRAPECMLTRGNYGSKMDIWAVGCVFYEMFTLQALFPGDNELDQLDRIHMIVGSPSEQSLERFKGYDYNYTFPKRSAVNWHTYVPMLSINGIDVLKKTLAYHPESRISAKRLLAHPYFDDLRNKVFGDTITARFMEFSKSDSIPMKKLMKKSNASVDSRKTSRSSLVDSIRGNVKTKIKSMEERFNYQRERNWNNPKCSLKRHLIKNHKSSVNSHFSEE